MKDLIDPNFVAPITALGIVAAAILLGLAWFHWRDSRDAKRKDRSGPR